MWSSVILTQLSVSANNNFPLYHSNMAVICTHRMDSSFSGGDMFVYEVLHDLYLVCNINTIQCVLWTLEYLKLHETQTPQTFMLPPMGAMYVRHNVRTSNCKLRSLQSACRCGLCVLLHTDKIQQERSKNAPKLGQTIKYFMCLWLKLMHVIFKKI